MKRTLAIVIVLLSLVLILAACAGQATAAASTQASTAPSIQSTSGAGLPATPQSQPVPVTAPTPAAAPAPKPAGPIKVKEITTTVSNDTASVPLTEVQNNWNTHFLVDVPGGKMGFMAYVLDNVIYVRASICPPCRGKTYTLDGNTLVCDICGTTFNAKTGIGIAGACVNYPKASVTYEVANGNLKMKISDLTTAYQNTLKPGLP
jgi:nitrite reductase/ring-hydroxylating ferredoxin subunit